MGAGAEVSESGRRAACGTRAGVGEVRGGGWRGPGARAAGGDSRARRCGPEVQAPFPAALRPPRAAPPPQRARGTSLPRGLPDPAPARAQTPASALRRVPPPRAVPGTQERGARLRLCSPEPGIAPGRRTPRLKRSSRPAPEAPQPSVHSHAARPASGGSEEAREAEIRRRGARGGTQAESGPATTPSEDNGERDGGARRGRGGAGPAPANPVGSASPARAPPPAPSAPTRPLRPAAREPGARPQPADRGGARDSGPSRDVGGSGSCGAGPPSPGRPSPRLGLGQPLSCVARAPGRGRGGRQERLGSSPLRARPQGSGPGVWREGPATPEGGAGPRAQPPPSGRRGREVPGLGRGPAGPAQTVPRGPDKPRAKCRETGCDLFSRRACPSGEQGAVTERRAEAAQLSCRNQGPRGAGRGPARRRRGPRGAGECPGGARRGPSPSEAGKGVTPSAVRPAGPRPLLPGEEWASERGHSGFRARWAGAEWMDGPRPVDRGSGLNKPGPGWPGRHSRGGAQGLAPGLPLTAPRPPGAGRAGAAFSAAGPGGSRGLAGQVREPGPGTG